MLAALQSAADHTLANDPGVAQFLVALPLEDATGNVIHVVEEFETKSAFESHQGLQSVKAVEALLGEESVVSDNPEIHVGPVAIKATSGRPLPLTADPAILLVGMEYKPGTVSNAAAGWKDMAEGAVKSVPGVNVFTVMEDEETSSIRTIEVLDSWESLGVLVQTNAAKQNIKHNGKDRTGCKSAIKLRAVAGFVGRLE
ncbi:phenylacetyl- ligase [Stagonosporopsis vannaccii]|nr:phenylacetyl- ligase [Stagonosporopsis vannaccii]